MTVLSLAEMFKVIRRLYEFELYDDLLLLAELTFPSEPTKTFNQIGDGNGLLEEDQRGLFFCYLADAYFQKGQTNRAIKNYEMALRCALLIKQKRLKNRYESILNMAEIHFQMAKAFIQNRQEEEALRCLEEVPQTEITPKILFKMARLSHNLSIALLQSGRTQLSKRNNNDGPSQRTIKHIKALIKEVPEAIFCRSFLLSNGSLKIASSILNAKKAVSASSDDDPSFISEFVLCGEAPRLWAKVKQLEGQKRFLEAAQLLDGVEMENLRLLLDQARLYRIAGNPKKALSCYQRAHTLDCTNAEGMDAFAALLGTQQQLNERQTQRELDGLAHAMAQHNPRRAESFIVFGWAARQCHRTQEAKQFAQRAEQLAQWRGRERAEALLLKAQLLADSKRISKETESVVSDLLHNDPTMTPAFVLCIQMCIVQKRFADAKRMAKSALETVGKRNHQIILLYAQALSDDGTSTGTETAVELLEKIVQDVPASVDCLLLLSRLYEKQQHFEQAISLLNRFKESCGDSRIHRELGDLLSKTNRPSEARIEYEKALNSGSLPDAETKDKMINLMAGFRTPQSAANAAFKGDTNSGGTAGGGALQRQPNAAPPPVARVTRRTSTMNNPQRRLRGGGVDEDGSLSTASERAGAAVRQIAGIAVRRIATARGSPNSPSVVSPMVLAPLRFDEDEEDNGGQGDDLGEEEEDDQLSEDGTVPLSIGDEDEEGTAAEEMSAEGSVEIARGTVSMTQHIQQIQQHIQRVQSFLSGDRGRTAERDGSGGRESELATPANLAQVERTVQRQAEHGTMAELSFEGTTPTATVRGDNVTLPIGEATLEEMDERMDGEDGGGQRQGHLHADNDSME
ncbi:hypothetical protein niasHT_015362 [Heterodera trifolii]|uniref:Uncharacterized protein n=1 Tax=Heterodera trifolii TaxID=157864 RepID=A0ABD2KZP2_9BILA